MIYARSPKQLLLKFDIHAVTVAEMKQATATRKEGVKTARQKIAASAMPDMKDLYQKICTDALLTKSLKDRTLNSIAAPEYYEEDGRYYRKTISMIPASREDVQVLQDAMDDLMMKHRGRIQGLCPVRRDIFRQCFDEVIRQMTLDCPERGLLLLRIRSEQNMTVAAMETLFSDGLVRRMGYNWDSETQDLDEIPTFKERQVWSFLLNKRLRVFKERLGDAKVILRSNLDRKEKLVYNLEVLRQKNFDAADSLKKKHSEDYHFVKRSNAALKIHIDETIKAIASYADLDPVIPTATSSNIPDREVNSG